MKSKDQLLIEQAYELVIESLSSPFEYERNRSIEDVGDAEYYDFYTDPEDPHRPQEDRGSFYRVQLMYDEEDGCADIEFAYHTKTGTHGTHAMTNTGNAFRVLATVKEIVIEFINRHYELNEIIFAAKADEKGRVALYKRLAQILVQYLGKDEWMLSNSTFINAGVPHEEFLIQKAY